MNELMTINYDPKAEEWLLLKSTIAKDLTEKEFLLFLNFCKFTGLNPFLKQIYVTKRGDTLVFQTSIDTFRSRASDTGKFQGELGPFWCAADGVWRDVWLDDKPPAAAKVGVLRDGLKEAMWAVAKYSEYVQTTKEGAPNSMWKKMPANQLAKCAEALALRKAFPEKLQGAYTDDEMGQADNNYVVPAETVKAKEIKELPRAEAIQQAESAEMSDAMSQILDLMAEMGWEPKKRELALQRVKIVGEEASLQGISKAYQEFLRSKKNVTPKADEPEGGIL